MGDQVIGLITGVTLGMLFVMLLIILRMQKQIARLSHLDAKLDLLLSHADIKFDPLAAMPREAADALKRGGRT